MAKKGHIGDRYRKVKISKESVTTHNKKQYAKIAILAIFLFIITLGGSYAIFTMTINGNKTTEVVSGSLTIEYLDKNEINLDKAYPMSNEEGFNTKPYTFTIKNTGTLNGKYTISVEEKEKNTLDKNYIKYSIREENGEWSTPVLLSSGLVLKENVVIENQKETTYELKMWLDENAPNEVQGKTYSGKIVVSTVQTNSNKIETTAPIIELKGEKVVTIEENAIYTDAGVSKITSNENLNIEDITTRYEYYDGINTIEVERIDTSKIGIYYIYYEIKDSKNNIGITSRVVNIKKKDTNIPSVTLKGESIIALEYNEEYIEPGYVANDIEDGNLTDKVVVVGTVNKEVSGTYVIKYIVIDSYGNTSSVTREVIVNSKNRTINLETTKEENENLTAEIIIEAETENDKIYYAVTTSSEKPNDNEYKEMDLVTSLNNKKNISPRKLTSEKVKITKLSGLKKFKKTIEIVKNGTYYVFIKDNKENIESKSIDVDNIDETKPNCEFSTENYVGVNKTKEITLTCTDPADINNENIEKDYFEIGNSSVLDITVGDSTRVENGYQYRINILGKAAGTTSIKLLSSKIIDKVGNKNEFITKEIKVTDIEVASTEVKLDLNGINISQIKVNGTNQGSITYASSNDSIAKVDENGLITGISPGITTIIVEETNGKVQKEINVVVVKQLTVLYQKQGSGITGIGSTKATCEVTDSSGKCSIVLPSITVSEGYTVIGWNEDKDATTGTAANTEVKLSKDTTTYYTISRKDAITLTATFNKNGATSQTISGGTASTDENINVSCKLEAVYNTTVQSTSCTITTPSITASAYTPIVVGYAETSDATIANIEPNKSLTLSSNKKYYAITKSSLKTYTATFNKNGATSQDDDSNSYITKSCNIPVTYNGASQNPSCTITTPNITASTATPTVCGYTTTSTGTSTCSIKVKTNISLSKDIEYYAQTYKDAVTKSVAFKIASDSHVTKITSGQTSITNTTDNITLKCNIAATYNGESQSTSCTVESPMITPETGYKSAFWGTSASATSGTTSGGSVSSSNTTYYARALTGNSYTVNYYDGTTLKGSSNATVGTSFKLKSASSMSLTKTGYTFKGWTTTNGSTTVAYTDVQNVNNLTKTDGEVVNLYAVWMDETAPSCSWSTPGTITTGNTTTLTLTCTDLGSGVSSTNLTTSDFTVSDTTYGSITAVSSPSAVTNGYKYTVTVKGLSSGSTQTTNGSFNVSLNANKVQDVVGNTNEKTTSSAVTVAGRSYTATYVKGSNVTSVGATTSSCTSVGTATSCSVTLPSITVADNYVVSGWYLGTTKVGEVNDSYTLTETNTTNGKTELTAKAKDTTPPSCEWTSTSVNYNSTANLTLTCTDSASGIVSKILTTSNFTVSSSTYGSITAVSNPSAVTNGYAYTVKVKGVAAGSFTVSLNAGVISDNEGNTNEKTTSGNITVNKVSATNPSLTAYSGTYDENSHTITVSGGSGGTIQYSTDNSTWSTTLPTRTDAGTTTVYVRVLGDSNHTTTSAISSAITISRASMTIPSSPVAKNFTGSSQASGISCPSGSSAGGTTSATNAGTHTQTCTPDANHMWSDGTTTAKSISWVINKVGATLSCSNKTYNGASQTACSCSGGTVGGTYYATDAGTYTVSCTPDGNHTAPSNKSWTMSAASVAVSWGSTTTFTYNGSGQAPVVNSVTGVSGETVNFTRTTATAAGSYTSTASCSSVSGGRGKCGNYTLTGTTKSFTINRASMTIPSSPSAKNYTGSAQASGITCPSGSSTGGTTSATNAGTHTQTCTPDANHMWSDGTTTAKSISWVINKVGATLSCSNKTYNGASQTACSCSGGTVSGTYAATDAGTYTASCTADSNHTAPANKSWTMSAKSVAVSWGSTTTFTMNGTGQAPTASASSGITGETINVTRTTATAVGSYTSTASCSSVSGGRAKCSNYSLTGTTKAFTINGITRTITWSKGSNVTSIGTTTSSCTTTGTSTSCSITSPSLSTITPSTGYTAQGWATSSTATTSAWDAGTAKSISTNATYYAFATDVTSPTCGSWSGESTTWTNSTRTISVGCSDSGSKCTASTFSKSYSTSTKTANVSITIKDNAGNTATCTKTGANIYVDVDKPNQPSIYRGYGLYVTDNAAITYKNINYSDYSSSGYYKIATTTNFPQIDIIPQRTFTNVIGYMQKINSRNQALPFYLYYSTTSSTFTTGNYSTLSTTTSASNSNNRYYMNFGKEVTLSRNQSILRVRVGTAANLVYNLSGGYIVAAINQQEYTASSYEILLQNNGDTGGSGFKQFECKFGENATSYEKVDTVYDSFYIATKSSSEITKDMLVSCRAVDNAGNRAYAHTVHFYLN